MGGDPHTKASKRGVNLGIEGGATRTIALFADSRGQILKRIETRPLNLKLSSDDEILRAFRGLRLARSTVRTVSICLAGCRTERDRARIRDLAARIWPHAGCLAGSDLESGFAAAFGPDGTGILVISGTGSCVFGRDGDKSVKAGGLGHLLGDRGSGYWIALQNLRAAILD
ncbi:MAG: BadF/BadG/BcrA/BcrD ATPase family protein, partial [Gammaproteobacteria bacterium]